jgi:hypothetical protein
VDGANSGSLDPLMAIIRQPYTDRLSRAKRILLAGCGGGYDVFGAVPLLFELRELGKEVHLASLSFSSPKSLRASYPEPSIPTLFTLCSRNADEESYSPEAWLAQALQSRTGREETVWCFQTSGVGPLRDAYQWLVRHLRIDLIVLIDGGIDALLRGDECSLGTPAEDLTSLAAVSLIEGTDALLACVGFGAEIRDGVSHAQALERIAELTRTGAFLGTSSILANTAAGETYLQIFAETAIRQRNVHGSHVHSVLARSVRGEFGAKEEHTWISPLLSLFWFFDARMVAATNLLVPEVIGTQTLWEVVAIIEALRKSIPIRKRTTIPI